MRQIHARARLRVDVGEAPRYELIKAETELLTAQKTVQAAQLRGAGARRAAPARGRCHAGRFRTQRLAGDAVALPPLPRLREQPGSERRAGAAPHGAGTGAVGGRLPALAAPARSVAAREHGAAA